jgi:hypothetical protein
MNLLLELSISWLQYYAWVLRDQDTVQQELWKVFLQQTTLLKILQERLHLCDVEDMLNKNKGRWKSLIRLGLCTFTLIRL